MLTKALMHTRVKLQLAGALAALIALNLLSVKEAQHVLVQRGTVSEVLRKSNIYGYSSAYVMWHLRAYLKCVAIGENLPLHDCGSAALGRFDHAYVCRRIQEQMGAIAAGSHPFPLRQVNPSSMAMQIGCQSTEAYRAEQQQASPIPAMPITS